jgi:MIP family channel proteins
VPKDWIRLAVAEAIGTFALVFIGVLSVTVGFDGSLVGAALAYGLVVAVMVAALGHVSGGHFNPAITLGFVVTRRMNLPTAALYWGAQLAGALLGGLVVLAATSREVVIAGTPVVPDAVNTGAAILLELVGTFFLVLVFFGTALDERAPRSIYPFAIGLTLTVAVLAIGPATGGALNPARWFGSGVASWTWEDFYVYWIGPLVGGVLGALAYRWLTTASKPRTVVAKAPGAVPTASPTTSTATSPAPSPTSGQSPAPTGPNPAAVPSPPVSPQARPGAPVSAPTAVPPSARPPASGS